MFIACGLNHKTAPLAVREQFSVPNEQQSIFLRNLIDSSIANEALILSTCNRTEIYCDAPSGQDLIDFLTHQKNQHMHVSLYSYTEERAVQHILRVATGLDSMMIGEPQIFGQLKQAYHQAQQLGTIHQRLTPIFQFIFSASKRIRHQSGINKNPISIASVAAQWIVQHFNTKDIKVLLIGTGETALLVAKYLHQYGITKFTIASRNPEIAQSQITFVSGRMISIQEIPLHLYEADVVISATACPLPFINKSLVSQALKQRKNTQQPLLLLDLAVPRDIEPDVKSLVGVHLLNIDDLHLLIDHGLSERHCAANHAESLIEHQMSHYIRSRRWRNAKQLICSYRHHMHHIAQQELSRAHQRLTQGEDQTAVLNDFSRRLVNKLTHMPTMGLRQLAHEHPEALLKFEHYFPD